MGFPALNVLSHNRYSTSFTLDHESRELDDPDLSDQSPAPEYLAIRNHARKGHRSDAEILETLDYRDEESAIVEYPACGEDSRTDEWDSDNGTLESFSGDEESPWESGHYVSYYAREAELEDDPDEPDYRDDVYFDDDFEAEMYFDGGPDDDPTSWEEDDS